jgi:acyl carrier protein
MRASTQKIKPIPIRPPTKKSADVQERIDEILIFQLDIESEEDLTPQRLLADLPGYDEDWTSSYLTALLEEEFNIELLDEEMAKLKTVADVRRLIQRSLKKS